MTPDEAKTLSSTIQDLADVAGGRAALHLKMATIFFATELIRALVERQALASSDIVEVCDALVRRAMRLAQDLPRAAQDMAEMSASVRAEITGQVGSVVLS